MEIASDRNIRAKYSLASTSIGCIRWPVHPEHSTRPRTGLLQTAEAGVARAYGEVQKEMALVLDEV